MALTFSTGQTLASAADSATNWAVARIAGSGGAPSFGGLDNTVYIQGTGSVSAKIANTDTDAVVILDWYANTEGGKSANTTVDLTTSGNEVICGWMNLTTPSVVRTLANGGIYVLVQSSTETGTTAPTVYSKWYIGGSGAGEYGGGWQFFMVDTRKTPSTTGGGGASLSSVRRIGFGIYTGSGHSASSIKADNMFVDAIWYKWPNYKVIGDGSTTCTWANFLSDSETNKNNLIRREGATYFLSCGVQFGDASQSATTTFADSTGQKVEFKRYLYYSGGSVDALNYSDYYIIQGAGAASFRTSITFGTVVGTGDDRQGVLGGSISTPSALNVPWKMDFQTDKTDLSAVKLYGMNLFGAYNGILFDNDSGAPPTETAVIGCIFNNCGQIDVGSTGTPKGAVFLSNTVIDPYGGTAANRGLLLHSTHNAKRCSFITSGTPSTQHMVHLPDTGTYTIGFDAMKFFGDYSSGTLWHGEDSANNSNTVTISATNLANPDETEFEETGTPAGTVKVSNDVALYVHCENEAGTDLQNVQVYIQKAALPTYTSSTGNNVGDTDIVVQESIAADTPTFGKVIVKYKSQNKTLIYRYTSWATSTFTMPTSVTGTANTGGSNTVLKRKTGTSFLTADIEEGDTIRNTTDGSYAFVDEIVDADTIYTSPLTGGSDNTWSEDDAYSLHTIALAMTNGTDICDVPLVNLQTDSNGEVTKNYNYPGSEQSIVIKARRNYGAPKYIPTETAGTIDANGLSINIVMLEDEVAS